MRKVVLYIAMSLDGYIADKTGGVSWLVGDESEPENQGTYGAFIETIDTVILGYTTYHQIITELSPEEWVYPDKRTYVITHKDLKDKENIMFTNQLEKLVVELKAKEGKDIWICGGAKIVNELLETNLIDRLCVTVVPTILGQGTPLFAEQKDEKKLKFISSKTYNGFTDLVYEQRV